MKCTNKRFCHAVRQVGETVVQEGLAMTPADVLRSAEAGIPIQSQMNTSNFDDGHTGSDFHIDLADRRGVDIGHLWQEQQSSRKKMRQAHETGENVIVNPG